MGTEPIGAIQVIWHGQWDQSGNNAIIGRGFHFVSILPPHRELQSGQSRRFALMKPQLREALSYAAPLPPDQYRLAIHALLPGRTDTHEIDQWTGSSLSHAIDGLENYLATEKKETCVDTCAAAGGRHSSAIT